MFKYKSVKRYINRGLKEKQLSKEQAAFILDIDVSYLEKIILGDEVPPINLAQRIGLLLGFDWGKFYEPKPRGGQKLTDGEFIYFD